jgi:hypothetical protein
MLTPELPKQVQVQAQFDAASAAGVSPCMWIPPKWEDLSDDTGRGTKVLPDNCSDEGPFKNPEATEAADKRVRDGNLRKEPKSPESLPNKENWTNPFSDFSHIDDLEFPFRSLELVRKRVDPAGDAQKLDSALTAVAGMFEDKRPIIVTALKGDEPLFEKTVQALKGAIFAEPGELAAAALVVKDPGQVHDLVWKVVDGHQAIFESVVDVLQGSGPGYDLLAQRNALNRLQRIVGADSPGMKRLALVYEWALYRTTVLMKDLNDSLDKTLEKTRDEGQNKGQKDYNDARTNYLNFLRDLDDREPELKDRLLEIKEKKAPSGYGKALKWACIDPVIFRGRISGARVVIRWNPHSSSNGIPIQHNP